MPSTALTAILWTVLGYLLGSVPFAWIIGRLLFKKDLLNCGDCNPGATNLWKTCGIGWGALAYILDFGKGTLPVAVCYYHLNITGWWLVPIALAPIAGHAFSVFLRFRGGKAIATTYGVWAGLTIWEAPLVLIITTYAESFFQKVHSWTQVFTMLILGTYVAFRFNAQPVFLPFMAIWAGNLLVIVIRHRDELKCLPQPQPWLRNMFKKNL